MKDGEKTVSRAVAEACLKAEHDPTLESMLKKGLPLARNTWLAMSWGHEQPKGEDWSAEHEMEVPECFRDPDAVQPHPGKRRPVAD